MSLDTHNQGRRESWIEWLDAFEILDLLGAEIDIQRSDIVHELFDFTTTDDRKHVW